MKRPSFIQWIVMNMCPDGNTDQLIEDLRQDYNDEFPAPVRPVDPDPVIHAAKSSVRIEMDRDASNTNYWGRMRWFIKPLSNGQLVVKRQLDYGAGWYKEGDDSICFEVVGKNTIRII